MDSVCVVPPFDVVEDHAPGLVTAGELLEADAFRFDGLEEGLRYGVVPAVSLARHTLGCPDGS